MHLLTLNLANGNTLEFEVNFNINGLNMKIVFFGTPEFAVASLRILIENKMDVVAVVTAPDQPAGRGLQIKQIGRAHV